MKKDWKLFYIRGKLEVLKIIRDNEPGVLYLQNHTGAGLTLIVNQNGKSLVDEGF